MSEENKTPTPAKDTTPERGKWHGGKGSTIRKGSDKTAYEQGWERIFGKKDKKD
jgi:hypothetical protein